MVVVDLLQKRLIMALNLFLSRLTDPPRLPSKFLKRLLEPKPKRFAVFALAALLSVLWSSSSVMFDPSTASIISSLVTFMSSSCTSNVSTSRLVRRAECGDALHQDSCKRISVNFGSRKLFGENNYRVKWTVSDTPLTSIC